MTFIGRSFYLFFIKIKNKTILNNTNLKITIFLITLIVSFFLVGNIQLLSPNKVGEVIDELNGVEVFYNGKVSHVNGRNVVKGYNVGLKWQCVEFVKRYYLEAYQHKMPDSYGHAKDFFNPSVKDGEHNKMRNLRQFSNPSAFPPQVGDIVIFDKSRWNKFGHVAIISKVENDRIEIIQQNKGVFGAPRETINLTKNGKQWKLDNDRVVGRLSL